MNPRYNFCSNPALKYNTNGAIQGYFGGTRIAATGFQRPNSYQDTTPDDFIGPQDGPVLAGQIYTYSCYFKTNYTGSFTVQINWYDGLGGYVGASTNVTVTATAGVVDRASCTATAPALAERGLLLVALNANTIEITMLLYEQATTMLPYFDGDSPNATWDGADGNSSSTYTPPTAAQLTGFMPFFE